MLMVIVTAVGLEPTTLVLILDSPESNGQWTTIHRIPKYDAPPIELSVNNFQKKNPLHR